MPVWRGFNSPMAPRSDPISAPAHIKRDKNPADSGKSPRNGAASNPAFPNVKVKARLRDATFAIILGREEQECAKIGQ
ncbi:hypothetical protein TRM7557_03173 [Tritonibacter multivorans]|uniref:Uncharacterized protein n=1 Tax=Tritonibacter multivorans TaxID=928856 RepID=A0A0P1GGI9_9RHOB|nr:hypothetical protein TRM7557_03173 [Tritonibacter multivorans]SFC25212.1 hypothetical protein SAMN04488049_1028 [Tritonibacter multivorans]